MPHSLIDIGANLTHDNFVEDLDAVLGRAATAGVGRMIVTGSDDQGNIDAAELAETHPGRLFATAGVHPHHAAEYTDASDELIRSLLLRKEVVAVGECGLDYFRDLSPRDVQREAFRSQLDIAADTGKPLFLHQRDAHDDFVNILEPALAKISRAVAHCFTGKVNLCVNIWPWGYGSESRAGSATNVAARTCRKLSQKFRTTVC